MEDGLINCLRCRHAKPEPDTDFNKTLNPPLFCAKTGRRSTCILSGCGLADPRRKYHNRVLVNGDKTRTPSEVELMFLCQFYPTLSWEKLEEYIGRKRDAIETLAYTRGLRRSPNARRISNKIRQTRKSHGHNMNDAQIAYILERYRSGSGQRVVVTTKENICNVGALCSVKSRRLLRN